MFVANSNDLSCSRLSEDGRRSEDKETQGPSKSTKYCPIGKSLNKWAPLELQSIKNLTFVASFAQEQENN